MSSATESVGSPAEVQRCRHADVQRPAPRLSRTVVAVLMFRHGQLCLLRRSQAVSSDQGKWHCVTGFVDSGVDPQGQALVEICEETGLAATDLDDLSAGPVLDLLDPAGHTWRIHVFTAQVQRGELALNWEHDAACWVSWPSAVATLALVPWLTDLVDAVTIPSTAIAA